MDTFFSDDDYLDLTDTEVNKRSKDKDDDSLIIVQDEASQTEIINIDMPEKSRKFTCGISNYGNKSKISDDVIDLDSFVEDVEGSSSFKSELRSKDRRYEKEKDSSVHIIPVTKIIDDLEDYEDVISDSDSEILPPVIWNHSRSEKNKSEDGKTLGDSTAKLLEDNESCFTPGKSFLVKVKKTGDLDKSIKTMKEENKQDGASHEKSSRKKTVTFSQVSVKKTGSGSENKEKESNFEEMFRSIEANESLPDLRKHLEKQLQGYATGEKSVKSLDTVETKIRKSKKEAKKRRSDESDVISKDILDGVSKSKQARKAPESPGTMLQIKRTIKNVKRPEPPEPLTPAVTVSIDDLLTEMQRDQSKTEEEPTQKTIKIKVVRSEDVVKVPSKSKLKDMEADIEKVLEMFPTMQAEVVRHKFRQIKSKFKNNILERVVDSLMTESEALQAASVKVPASAVNVPSTEEDIQVLLGSPKITIRIPKDQNTAKEEPSKPSEREVNVSAPRYAKGSKRGDGSKGKAPAKKKKKPICTLPTPVLSSDSSNEGHDVVMEESSMEIQGVGSDLPDLDDSSSSVTDSSQNASSKKDTENGQHFGQGQQQPNVTSQPSSMNPIHSQGNLGNPQNVSLQQQVVSSQMGAISVGNINSTGMTQVGNQPGQPIYSNPQLVQNQGMPSAEFEGQQNQAAAQMKDRKIIWRGLLEWQEKVKPGGPQQPKVSRQLQCHLSIGHSDPDINASNWPKELIMQLIPQSLLSSTQLQPLFKNSRQVAFHFGSHNLEALKNLYKVMGTGFAGCVHFPSPSQCDVRVLLLLFSNKRKAFIGLIPNDQTAFVQGIRTVIYSHKMKVGLQQKQQNMLQQAAGAQMPASNMQFPGQQPNMLPQGMSQNQFNMQQQPANTMQNTVMQSQPPGMQKQISQQNMARQQAEVQQQQKLAHQRMQLQHQQQQRLQMQQQQQQLNEQQRQQQMTGQQINNQPMNSQQQLTQLLMQQHQNGQQIRQPQMMMQQPRGLPMGQGQQGIMGSQVMSGSMPQMAQPGPSSGQSQNLFDDMDFLPN